MQTGTPAKDASTERAFRTFAWLWAIRWGSSIACDVYDSAFPLAHAGSFAQHVTATITAVASALALAALAASDLPRARRVAAGAAALVFAVAAAPALARVSADVVLVPAPAWATRLGDLTAVANDRAAPLAGVVLALAARQLAPKRLVRALAVLALLWLPIVLAMSAFGRALSGSFDRAFLAYLGVFGSVWCLYGCALAALVVTTALVAAGDATADARRRAGLLAWSAAGAYILAVTALQLAHVQLSAENTGIPYWLLVGLGAALIGSAGGGRASIVAVAGAGVSLFAQRFLALSGFLVLAYGDAYLYVVALASSLANAATALCLLRLARAAERRILARIAAAGVVAGGTGLVSVAQNATMGLVAFGALIAYVAVLAVVAYLLQKPPPVAEPPPSELSVGGVED